MSRFPWFRRGFGKRKGDGERAPRKERKPRGPRDPRKRERSPQPMTFENDPEDATEPDAKRRRILPETITGAAPADHTGVTMRCQLLENERVEVAFQFVGSNEEQDFVRVVLVQFAGWETPPNLENGETRAVGILPLTHYKSLLSTMRNRARIFGISEELNEVLRRNSSAIGDTTAPMTADDLIANGVPEGLARDLYPFQRDTVAFARSHHGRIMIADEMGLGKTVQAVAVATLYQKDWPLLIIVPSSVRMNWVNELHKRVPSLRKSDVNVILSGSTRINGMVTVISYDLAYKVLHTNKAEDRFGVIICDESHYLKNTTAQRTKQLLPILQRCKRLVLLSGTPALNRPIELYPQIAALNKDLAGGHHAFGVRYCHAHRGPFGWDYTGASNLEELELMMRKCVMVRRLKNDVLSQLPTKSRKLEQVVGDFADVPEMRQTLSETKNNLRMNRKSKELRATILKLYSQTALVKVAGAMAHLQSELQKPGKILFFAHHLAVLDAASAFCRTHGVPTIRIDGATPSVKRTELVTSFQSRDQIRVAILSITAAGIGITLTAASRVIIGELPFTPAGLLQAEDRAHRIGQTQPVDVQVLVCPGSVDDVIWPLLQRKLVVLQRISLSEGELQTGDTANAGADVDMDVDWDAFFSDLGDDGAGPSSGGPTEPIVTAPAAVSEVPDGFILCERCSEAVEPNDWEVHEDMHVAQEVEEQERRIMSAATAQVPRPQKVVPAGREIIVLDDDDAADEEPPSLGVGEREEEQHPEQLDALEEGRADDHDADEAGRRVWENVGWLMESDSEEEVI